ncbi:hypothetical protein BDV93DRAFT_558130 [Ceratobasidium sp. AG-I]|nr:hypothetical protein BDV93DRAFT_558130 [Ceratobasidium sp. AG-I]
MNMLSAPILHFLLLRWKTRMENLYENDIGDHLDFSDANYSFSGPQMPRLRSLDFDALPTRSLFARPEPLLSGLTHLGLALADQLCPPHKLHALLCPNLRLQSLVLSSAYNAKEIDFEPTGLRVELPLLKYFSFTINKGAYWGLAVIQMINAPMLERLKLGTEYGIRSFPELVEYITTGTVNGNITRLRWDDYDIQPLAYAPIYPMLQNLDIQHIGVFNNSIIRTLLFPFVTVTHVSLPDIHVLGDVSWVLPNLICMRCNNSNKPEINEIVRRRTEAGHSIKRVEVVAGEDEYSRDDWPDSVDVVTLPPITYESDSDKTQSDTRTAHVTQESARERVGASSLLDVTSSAANTSRAFFASHPPSPIASLPDYVNPVPSHPRVVLAVGVLVMLARL